MAGKIIKLENDYLFVEDCQGVVWVVDASKVEKEYLIKLVPKIRVKIIGEKKERCSLRLKKLDRG